MPSDMGGAIFPSSFTDGVPQESIDSAGETGDSMTEFTSGDTVGWTDADRVSAEAGNNPNDSQSDICWSEEGGDDIWFESDEALESADTEGSGDSSGGEDSSGGSSAAAPEEGWFDGTPAAETAAIEMQAESALAETPPAEPDGWFIDPESADSLPDLQYVEQAPETAAGVDAGERDWFGDTDPVETISGQNPADATMPVQGDDPGFRSAGDAEAGPGADDHVADGFASTAAEVSRPDIPVETDFFAEAHGSGSSDFISDAVPPAASDPPLEPSPGSLPGGPPDQFSPEPADDPGFRAAADGATDGIAGQADASSFASVADEVTKPALEADSEHDKSGDSQGDQALAEDGPQRPQFTHNIRPEIVPGIGGSEIRTSVYNSSFEPSSEVAHETTSGLPAGDGPPADLSGDGAQSPTEQSSFRAAADQATQSTADDTSSNGSVTGTIAGTAPELLPAGPEAGATPADRPGGDSNPSDSGTYEARHPDYTLGSYSVEGHYVPDPVTGDMEQQERTPLAAATRSEVQIGTLDEADRGIRNNDALQAVTEHNEVAKRLEEEVTQAGDLVKDGQDLQKDTEEYVASIGHNPLPKHPDHIPVGAETSGVLGGALLSVAALDAARRALNPKSKDDD
nr:hypothetical protein [uncultured Rhodopila sp.]